MTPDGATGRLLRACLVVALLTTPLAGCATLTEELESDPPLPDSETAAEKRDSLETLSATVTTVEETNETTRRIVKDTHFRFEPMGFRERIVSVETADPGTVTYVPEGQIYVANQSILGRYDPTSDKVSYSSSRPYFERPFYFNLVSAARANESLDRTEIPALPRAPAPPTSRDDTEGSFNDDPVNVSYNGTGTVDGREAYRLEVVPRETGTQLRSLTVWLDTETLFPLKERFKSVFRGERETFTRTRKNVSVNPTLDPATFRLDPKSLPRDPAVTPLQYHDSHETLTEAVTDDLPAETLAAGYRYDRGFHIAEAESTVIAHYTTADGPPVRLTTFPTSEPSDDGNVSLGPVTGTFDAEGGLQYVTWVSENRRYTLSGDLDRETLLQLARTAAESTGG